MRNAFRIFLMFGLASALTGCGDLDFSPDGKHVAFTWPGADGKPQLVIGDLQGGAPKVLGTTKNASGALWSPDGKRLLFYDEGTGRTGVWDDTKGAVRTLPVALVPPFAWREDSGRVAGTVISKTGKRELVTVALTELGVAHRVDLPTEVADIAAVTWIAQTDEVAFLGQKSGKADIYLTDGGIPSKVTTTGDIIGFGPAANHRDLLFARPSKNSAYILCTLFRYNTQKRSVDRLPFPDRIARINPTSSNAPTKVSAVFFSPEGNRLAILTEWDRTTGDRARIHTVSIDGTNPQSVADMPRKEDAHPAIAWTRDSQNFGVLMLDGMTAHLYLTDAATGRRRSIYKK